MKLSEMNLKVFLIISSFFCVQSAPAKPLNERSTELTWQAWLLVDDQNQNKQTDADGLIRRRITPKSVFIAPTFSPDSLPPCADGYTSDPMGRCIKIIQLDADAQLNFILDRLKQQFGEIDEYDDYEEMLPTPGPFQLNIPLGSEPDDKIQDTNIAIVVAPTNGNFDLTKNDTLVIKKNEDPPQSELDAPIIVTKINIKDDNEFKAPIIVVHKKNVGTERISTVTKKVDSATEKMDSITDEITEMFEISTQKLDDYDLFSETTTTDATPTESTTFAIETTTDLPETTTLPVETTRLEQAIFFKLPNITKTNETNQEEIQASEDKQIENYVRFPDENLSQTQLLPDININNRFRDEPIIKQKLPAIEIKNQFEPTLYESINPDDRRIFNNRDTSNHNLHHRQPEVVTHHIPESQNHHNNDRLHSVHRVFNHRNRDKTWQFPPDYRESQPQKPLVLRFTNGNHRQANDFYQHHTRQQDPVYRQVPPDDLSYIFGFKKGITHR